MSSTPRLRLRYVGFDSVEFGLEHRDEHGDVARTVRVLVGSGPDWLAAVRFPHIGSDTGASTGDTALDELIRQHAAEELIRLDAACRESRDGRVVA